MALLVFNHYWWLESPEAYWIALTLFYFLSAILQQLSHNVVSRGRVMLVRESVNFSIMWIMFI